MILVRNVFQLKFGTMREAVALWQEGMDIARRAGAGRDLRLLTDITGRFYTLVLEETFDSLAQMEQHFTGMQQDEWRTWYARFTPLVESGTREMYNIVGTGIPSLPAPERGERAAQGWSPS